MDLGFGVVTRRFVTGTSRLLPQLSRPRVVMFLTGLLLSGSFAIGGQEIVDYVPARSYYQVAQRELANAKRSITVCLYLMSLRSTNANQDVFELAQSLVRARASGVRVQVYLDNNSPEDDPSFAGFNSSAVAFLQAQGIAVYQDDRSRLAHGKMIIIDEKTILAGSSNWTDAALNKNSETNFLIRSTDAAHSALSEIRRLPWRLVTDLNTQKGTSIPLLFLQNPRLLGAMAANRDERALDVALLLFSMSTATLVNVDDLANRLALGGWTRESSRRQVKKTLNKLQNRYGLIQVEHEFSKDSRVLWNDVHDGESVRVPETYWSFGWDRRLSLAGKCFFLISQAESARAATRPRWSAARTTLAQRHHLSTGLITRGITELRRQNLVEVEYGPLTKDGASHRPPNMYTPNPLSDPAVFEEGRKKLIARAGADAVARAEKTARLIYEDSDGVILEELVDLESRYGRRPMAHAVRVISRMNVDNPKRNFPYLKAIVQTESGEGHDPDLPENPRLRESATSH